MLLTLIAMLAYGALHTALAGWLKPAFRARFGERTYHGLYRILFNVVVTVTLVPIGLLVVDTRLNSPPIWTAPDAAAPLLFVVQAAGVIGGLVSLLQTDLGRFTGIAQLSAYLDGRPLPLPVEPLQTGGVYRLVRHPLYLFSLMIIWPVQRMGGAYFGFCLGATIYFAVGSLYEENRLIAGYGNAYVEYRRRVPWLVPLLRLPGRGNRR